jgi:hypothetical protein
MMIIEHRINTLGQLQTISPEHGAEVDLRSDPQTGNLYLHHEPFVDGQNFDEWLKVFKSLPRPTHPKHQRRWLGESPDRKV